MTQQTANQGRQAGISLIWANRQRAVRVDLKLIRKIVEEALPLCVERPQKREFSIPPQIEITLLGEAAIAKIHEKFLGDNAPTDVITFDHGEILIGVPVAAANAKKFLLPLDHEVALCVIHGLLHLLGYNDLTEKQRKIMHRRQGEILEAALKRVC